MWSARRARGGRCGPASRISVASARATIIAPVSDDAAWLEVRDGETLTVYRLVTTGDQGSADLLECFKSNAELGKPPRPGRERREPLVHQGLSVFRSKDGAVRRQHRIVASLRPGEAPRIGTYVATVVLRGPGPTYQDRGDPDGHITVRVEASVALAGVVDIERIES